MATLMKQEDMVVGKDYGTLNKNGVLFIIHRNNKNQLFKLVSRHEHVDTYKRIKSLTKARNMFEPSREDFSLFLR